MIDLKLKIEQIIDSEYESHIDNMLDADYLYADMFTYYQNDILADFQEYIGRELNQYEIDKIYDYLIFWNPEENLEYQEQGFPHAIPGKFAIIGNMSEIEIDLTNYFSEKTLKKASFIDAINSNTDLIVYQWVGYYPIEYDTITVKNDNKTLMEALLYPLHEIGE